jgi:hypothetical protein
MVRAHRVTVRSLMVIFAGFLVACGSSTPKSTNANQVTPIIMGLSLNPSTVPGGQATTVTVTLNVAAPTGGTVVTVTGNIVGLTIPPNLQVKPGATTTMFKILTPQVGSVQVVGLTAAVNGTSMQTTLTITPVTPLSVTGFTINPTSVPSGDTAQGVVTISAPAFVSGQIVDLISNSALVVVPPTVTIGAGRSSISFSIFTTTVTTPTMVTITALLNTSSAQASVTLALPPPLLTNLALQPNPVVGGQSTTGTVQLTQPAPSGGILITLLTNDTVTVPKLPATVTIAAGATQAQFMFSTIAVPSTRQVAISATQNTGTLNAVTQTVVLSVITTALSVSSLNLNPSSVTGGLPTTGTITISAAAPQGGIQVMLSSNNAAASVPASVVVPAGRTFTTFQVNTAGVATTQMATITATLGTSTQSGTLTVVAASALTVSTLSLSPTTVVEGATSTGTVTLSGPAAPGGTTVALTSSDPSVGFQPSANLTIPGGSTGVIFTITTTAGTAATATITATLNTSQKMATLTVVPPPTLVSVTLAVNTIVGGQNSMGTVTISAAAPGGNPTNVMLMSSDTSAVQITPTLTIAAGSTTATFPVTTLPVTIVHNVTITATLGGGMQTAMLTVTPPPPVVAEIFFNPPTIAPGQASTGTIVLDEVAPAGGVMVTLSLPSGTTAVTLPSTSIAIAAGATSATFTADAAASVTTQTSVQVTASLNSASMMSSLTVHPPPSGTLSEQLVVGGETTSTDFPVFPNPGALQTTLKGADSGTLTNINLSTTGGTTTPKASFSTFLGNSNFGQVRDVFVDTSGNVFACGVTSDSMLPTNPSGVVQRLYGGGNSDAFIVEFDSSGNKKFLTYLGGSGDDSCNSIFVDSTGNIFISGRSNSTDLKGPTTNPAVVQASFAGGSGSDFFIAKLASNAASTTWLAFLGGMSDDQASGRIAVDSMGNVYVSGRSQSLTDFPAPSTQVRPNLSIGVSTFGVLVKLNSTATQLTYTTFLFGIKAPNGVVSGTVVDASGGVVVTSSGIAYVCGAASATDMPVSATAFQPTLKGTQNAYVAQISSTGKITALTLLGGTSTSTVQACKGLALDSEGNIIVVTATDANDYPVTPGAFQTTLSGPTDFAITKLTGDLSTVVFSTLVGGSGSESADATRVELDASENIYFSLATNSGNFPGMVADSFQQNFKGVAGGANNNMAIVKLSADGTAILYATYLGGSSQNSTISLRYHKN